MSRAGLTLIELVVGLTIASALLAAGYSALGTALDRRDAAITLLTDDLDASAVRATLRAWLEGAHTTPESSGPLFSGVDGEHEGRSDDQLSFLTSARTPLASGTASVRLFIDRDPSTAERGLVAEFTAWLGTERARVQLAGEVTGLEVRYRSRLIGGRDWLPSWISSSVMPAGLELRLIGDGAEGALHPLLAHPVRIALYGGR